MSKFVAWLAGLFRRPDPIGDAMRDYAVRSAARVKLVDKLAEPRWDV